MKDLHTGEEFTPTRPWQKFATPQNRIAYNNARAAALRKHKSAIDKPIHTNYKILQKIMDGLTELTISQEALRYLDFDFKVLNNIERIDDKLPPCIYEYILLYSGSQIKIIKNDRYPKHNNY